MWAEGCLPESPEENNLERTCVYVWLFDAHQHAGVCVYSVCVGVRVYTQSQSTLEMEIASARNER